MVTQPLHLPTLLHAQNIVKQTRRGVVASKALQREIATASLQAELDYTTHKPLQIAIKPSWQSEALRYTAITILGFAFAFIMVFASMDAIDKEQQWRDAKYCTQGFTQYCPKAGE